ncbi:MAG: hypothetical protein E6Q76_14375 [Rhizobium sp.]|nr:MAG: hypothetical protein E6Q76_14375 [Rhizobium sp.]
MARTEEKMITHNGRTRAIREWAHELGYATRSFENRLRTLGDAAFSRCLSRNERGRKGSFTLRKVIRNDAHIWMQACASSAA